ncbi:hypothetical protein [Streptomyces ficellus]|uniref:Uncharacterized protein n=1 Tax=Streptomyces ficellus TaxID=1977088 RepID=A0A6I6FWD5_9ACTN|nr:hypothetical protein [Streptomyces ficellus]QGV76851.1 hypothetical protein EIZ62_00115 [Streptomyces ficellus]QGV82358.1 hypothetical protein EIZ62_31985 [Streptomyces ficellus]
MQNEAVGRQMTAFFQQLDRSKRGDPEAVAQAYGRYVLRASWVRDEVTLRDRRRLEGVPFCVGLAARQRDFTRLTQRVPLVSDTLLLSHSGNGNFIRLGAVGGGDSQPFDPVDAVPLGAAQSRPPAAEPYGMFCPDPGKLGRWVLEAEPLLRAGLVWYLPTYGRPGNDRRGHRRTRGPYTGPSAVDFLVRNGRAVETATARPLTGPLVRPVLEIDLPFLAGVGLRDFAQITVEEFDSYTAFRAFLRLALLRMDDAMDCVQSERALYVLSQEISEHVHGLRAQMTQARRTRALATTGAVVGTTGAVLVAVYGPALESALTVLGGGGGVLGVLGALVAEKGSRRPTHNPWYYVWALQRKSTGRR